MAGRYSDSRTTAFLEQRQDLVSLALRIVRSPALAEDLVQDSWFRWQGRAYPSDRARPILRRIVRNLALDWYRRQRIEGQVLTTYAIAQDDAPDTERVFSARQDLLKIVTALERLPDRSVKAFRLHRIDGLPYAKIAKRMDLSPSTAFKLVEDVMVEIVLALQE